METQSALERRNKENKYDTLSMGRGWDSEKFKENVIYF